MWVMIRPSGKYAEWLKNKLKKDYLFALGFNTIISFIPFLIILLIKICF